MSGWPVLVTRGLVLLVLLPAACKDDELVPATQVLVTVESDLDSQLSRIEFAFRDSEGTRKVPRRFEIVTEDPGADEAVLPFSLGVVKGRDTKFQLIVTGFGPGPNGDDERVVIMQSFSAAFRDRQTLELTVYLGSACYEQVCSSGTTCYPRAGNGVAAGACDEIPTAVLTPVEPGRELPEAGSGSGPSDAGEPEADAGAGSGGRSGTGGAGVSGADAGASGSGGAGGAGADGGAGAGADAGAGTGGSGSACEPACEGEERCIDGSCECGMEYEAYYQDRDADGHGNPSVGLVACGMPDGYVLSSDDCCDSDPGSF